MPNTDLDCFRELLRLHIVQVVNCQISPNDGLKAILFLFRNAKSSFSDHFLYLDVRDDFYYQLEHLHEVGYSLNPEFLYQDLFAYCKTWLDRNPVGAT